MSAIKQYVCVGIVCMLWVVSFRFKCSFAPCLFKVCTGFNMNYRLTTHHPPPPFYPPPPPLSSPHSLYFSSFSSNESFIGIQNFKIPSWSETNLTNIRKSHTNIHTSTHHYCLPTITDESTVTGEHQWPRHDGLDSGGR